MQYRQLGSSGLIVSALAFGTVTFGGSNPFFAATGSLNGADARRMIDLCLDAGVNLFDTADSYSRGMAEEILGQALKGRRDRALIATKVFYRVTEGANTIGLSRHHLIRSCEESLRRLGCDHIDLFQMHAFDGLAPIDETLAALDHLISSGKVRYVGCSNFSGWQLMKALGVASSAGLPRYVSHQCYYSLIGRDLECELIPLHRDQGIGTLVWSPLAWGRLTGELKRDGRLPATSRLHGADVVPVHDEARMFDVLDVARGIAAEAGCSIARLSLAWLLARPTVASVIIGARTEAQLTDNLLAADLALTPDQIARLDAASAQPLPYPYWHQAQEASERNPMRICARMA